MLTLVLVACGLGAGAWLLARLPVPRDTDRPNATGDPAEPDATVSVVIPARDEAATIPRLLGSIRRLTRPPHEVLVVDDGSVDGTADVAVAHGARVIAGPEPPPGWLGKPWACQRGAEAATGSHLLFLDADTWLATDTLDRLLAAHGRRGGLTSVQPYHVTVRPYEELSAVFNLVALMGTGAFAARRPGSGGDRSVAAAFGPCLLTTAADYAAAGGHRSVRDRVVEDVHLARRYRDAGLPVRCLMGDGTVRFRMYPGGPRQLVEGWTKNIAAGAGAAPAPAVIGAAAWVAALAAVAWAAIGGVAGHVRGGRGLPGPPLVLALVGWAIAAAELRWMLRRVGTFRRWTSLAFPVPLAAFVAVFARSLVLTALRGRVTWRGRAVSVGRSRRDQPSPSPAPDGR